MTVHYANCIQHGPSKVSSLHFSVFYTERLHCIIVFITSFSTRVIVLLHIVNTTHCNHKRSITADCTHAAVVSETERTRFLARQSTCAIIFVSSSLPEVLTLLVGTDGGKNLLSHTAGFTSHSFVISALMKTQHLYVRFESWGRPSKVRTFWWWLCKHLNTEGCHMSALRHPLVPHKIKGRLNAVSRPIIFCINIYFVS